MAQTIPPWFVPILLSALLLGFYDIFKKHAVRDNAVMPVLFLATLAGSALFVAGILLTGRFGEIAVCTPLWWNLILLKSLLVGASWTLVYYAMRDLPISIASPIRATAPLWTFFGGMLLFDEIPTPLQGIGMAAIVAGYYLFSVLGKREGISFTRCRGIHWIFLGTLLGAVSALYDKFLLGKVGIPRDTMQLWFSIDIALLLGLAWLWCAFRGRSRFRFEWRWTIPLTGIFLIAADYLYFYALSVPDTHISILSLVRRSNCIVSFGAGVFFFHDRNVRQKAGALALILAGVALLALAG